MCALTSANTVVASPRGAATDCSWWELEPRCCARFQNLLERGWKPGDDERAMLIDEWDAYYYYERRSSRGKGKVYARQHYEDDDDDDDFASCDLDTATGHEDWTDDNMEDFEEQCDELPDSDRSPPRR